MFTKPALPDEEVRQGSRIFMCLTPRLSGRRPSPGHLSFQPKINDARKLYPLTLICSVFIWLINRLNMCIFWRSLFVLMSSLIFRWGPKWDASVFQYFFMFVHRIFFSVSHQLFSMYDEDLTLRKLKMSYRCEEGKIHVWLPLIQW